MKLEESDYCTQEKRVSYSPEEVKAMESGLKNLFRKCIDGTATDKEKYIVEEYLLTKDKQINDHIRKDAEEVSMETWKRISSLLNLVKKMPVCGKPITEDDFEAYVQADREKRSKSIKRKNVLHRMYRYAAAAVIIIAVFLGGQYIVNSPFYSSEKLTQNAEPKIYIETAMSEIKKITLSDGSVLTMNGGSKLAFQENTFNKTKREIWLEEGEAFFEVVNNPNKPFIINVGKAVVKDIGTVFNVKKIKEKSTVVVAVQEGAVSFKGKNQDHCIILAASEVGIMNADENVKKIAQPAQNYFSWFAHFLEFENMPLPQVVEQLETIYGTEIELSNPDLKNKYFTAYMKATSVDEVLNQLALSLELKLKKIDGKYYLK